MDRKRLYFLRALSLLVSLTLIAILAEVALRIGGYRHGRASLAAFTRYDPLLGWRIAPNTDCLLYTSPSPRD